VPDSASSLEQLVDSLLYEGYALYPYTPGATKNATPTPFGIVYPSVYADTLASAFDHVELRCVLEAPADAVLSAEVRFLAVSSGLDRAGALARSLLSTHPILRVTGGRFISPLEGGSPSVNTFPVLATPADDAVVGAAIVLPDHPQIAPESRGGLFDSTEIEEALLLHVHALSDAERQEIERQDPAVREMVQRAAASTPQDIIALHGRVTLRDPQTDEPPSEPPGLVDPRVGEEMADVDGVTFRRGGKVLIKPGPDADLQARMLDGRTATIERIFTDYGGKTHLGVTIDDDPGQDLMRETGRYLFFFGPEVEVIES